ncbi:hypothetical protein [Oceanobacter mangrovi]|uniref:hypothetical protein n=1 Tax=Oceanobacter mangrovi TaxID=2862510 RepID=UPI001C8F05C8|nr:hypothetical protein [Oceanobacter mangrovi]
MDRYSKRRLFTLALFLPAISTSYAGPLLKQPVAELCQAHASIHDLNGVQRWCSLSSRQGNIEAQEILKQFSNTSEPNQPVDQPSSESLGNICRLHFQIMDTPDVMNWCSMAAKAGDSYGLYIMKILGPQ